MDIKEEYEGIYEDLEVELKDRLKDESDDVRKTIRAISKDILNLAKDLHKGEISKDVFKDQMKFIEVRFRMLGYKAEALVWQTVVSIVSAIAKKFMHLIDMFGTPRYA